MQSAKGTGSPATGVSRGLVALVVGMGVLIFVGLGLLAYGVLSRVGGPAAGFEALDLPIPAGCVIADSRLEGERVLLRLDGLAERGCQQVLLVDLASGEVTARITARPED